MNSLIFKHKERIKQQFIPHILKIMLTKAKDESDKNRNKFIEYILDFL